MTDIGKNENKRICVLMVAFAAALWGTYGVFMKEIFAAGMARNPMLLIRFAVTSLCTLAFILARDPKMLKIKLRDLPMFVGNGILSIVFFTSAYAEAVRATKIAVAASLLYTAPAFVMVMSALFFREKLTKRGVVCIALAIVGCALVSGLAGDFSVSGMGILWGLCAGFGYALYTIFSRAIFNRGYSAPTIMFYTFAIAAACVFALSVREGTAAMIGANRATAICVACGAVTGALAYVFYTGGLKGLEPSRAAQIATVEPVTAAILGCAIYSQMLSLSEILGVVLVVGSVIAMNLTKSEAA